MTVSSAYDGGAVAEDEGPWKVKVRFTRAPVGTSFTVKVSDGAQTKRFSFAHEG